MILDAYIRSYMKEFDRLDRKCWNYEDGCVLIGAMAMYEATQDEAYFESIHNFIDRYVKDDGIMYYDPEEYNIDKIPSGRVLFPLYRRTGNEKYRLAAELLMSQLKGQPRTECGNFWHKKIYPWQIWLDGLYMGMPFYAMFENEFGTGTDAYADMMNQFRCVRKYLYDEEKHLYYHAYDEKKRMFWADPETGLSENFWSRAIGWFLMALADCWALMPEEKAEYREELAKIWKEAIDGMLEYQDEESGLFYQLTALAGTEGNYLETSSSCMVAYSLLKGYRLGVLADESYGKNGEKILAALCARMFTMEHGVVHLGGMCSGAGLGPDGNLHRDGTVAYYLSEPVVCDEQKGVGAFMMAYSEWLRVQHCDRQPAPGVGIEIYNKGYKGGPVEIQNNFAKFIK